MENYLLQEFYLILQKAFLCDGGELRWVAVKGYANDWTIYCHWSYNNEKWIEKHGDKVCNERNIKKCITCNDDVFKRYRF